MSRAKDRANEASSEGRSLREAVPPKAEPAPEKIAEKFAELAPQKIAETPAPKVETLQVQVVERTSVSLELREEPIGEPPVLRRKKSKTDIQIEALSELVITGPTFEAPKPRVFSISELSTELRDSLRDNFGEVLVRGEICDFKGVHRNGHLYFALKDEKSQVRAVMWRPALQKVPFDVKGGLEVIVTGRLDYYGGSGSLQLVAERMEPVGMGALQLRLEQLKERLRLEGLFDVARKRKVAPLNWRIGVVTGKSTAALQDILKVYRTRFPLAEVFVFHASVQGENAPREVVRAIELANRYSRESSKPLDVLVVGRGGGSYEDLYCFNDESLVRAIVGSAVPVVSAVGHEIDVTLADFAADRRAATPSHAAQETVPEMALWLQRLEELEALFARRARLLIQDYSQRIDTFYNRMVAAAPQRKLAVQKQFLKDRELLLITLMQKNVLRYRAQISRNAAVLDALSPLKVLERGYAVAKLKEDGRALRSVHDARPGATINLLLHDGTLTAKLD